ncbi:uncharacterized protein BX663DRAFT_437538 [Cokeromyces recurvatus]|uniref:uncharacterized protein n=1 Tax=Cokeromyces recurvatus TaxID=90255 RepID=UPI00221E63C0|nr:uncharacterized protein BX663DRAFT_437538 [Cokeromyces recurvatus]KAI7901466.1 hypothetical protein BX663DRAFT_437538 [Cokeromyces recurvatus]
MVNNLYNRCKVDKCYVSYSSEASSSIESRDVKDGVKTLAKLKNVHGNTQDLINVVSSTSQRIRLVIIDYSGLCTNHTNIFQFVRDNKSIEKIIVDCFPFVCDVVVYSRRQILDDN